ncbi:hypothetical protein T12_1974 [Trichinella patagoniensis]|uniref:Uncharacterized protein n=1 Tax=Trichinella patagoniensis TaxID=990121 RepID=A0A0V0ZL14_9BILA|nr:hypothetical protein T12_1974 [Trichinella patagoniensis]
MKEIRLSQNNEILHNALQFQRIPHYNVKKLSSTQIQPTWSRFKGVPDGLLSCKLEVTAFVGRQLLMIDIPTY